MPRLTADLILRSSTYLNPLKERELDLRGNKIAVIENLGATQDQYDSIDLSDNEVARLEGFPLLNRLHTLLLNNNRVNRISAGLGETLPRLETLVLTNNKLANLADLDNLAELRGLRVLSLLDNLVTKKQHYRLYVIHKMPHLKLLDFRKIKEKERQASLKLFGSEKGKKVLSEEQATVEGQQQQGQQGTYNSEEVKAIKSAIEGAKSMEEFHQLERALAQGQVPEGNATG